MGGRRLKRAAFGQTEVPYAIQTYGLDRAHGLALFFPHGHL